jgi:peptidoglycan/LPS O-acetylase OafA/YrhL
MPWELRMYILLLAMWVLAKRAGENRPAFWSRAVLALFVVAAAGHIAAHFLLPETQHELRLLFMFFSGATFYVLRRHVVLSLPLAAAAALALGLGLLHREAFFLAYTAVTAYLLLWIAYIPAGFIRRFNRLGDYSYGTYIYAFPVQQITATLMPGVSVPVMILVSGTVTLALAVASWHRIERSALDLKEQVGKVARRWSIPRAATG